VALYSVDQFRKDLRGTLVMAGMYSLLAAIGFTILGLLFLTGHRVDGGGQPATIGTVLGAFGVFVAIYVVGALGSAIAVFLLRPLRASSLGWAATGALVSLACYSSLLGFTHIFRSTLAWLFATRGISTENSEGYGTFVLILLALIFVPIGAVAGVYWRDNPPKGGW
jgi:hypothetical protein